MSLSRCESCSGFSPKKSAACVHCGGALRKTRSVVKGALVLAGASIASMTLMACYGAPPCDHNANKNCDDFDVQGDGGTTHDAGTTDAGTDAGP